MNRDGNSITILMADDDHDDQMLTKEALDEAHLSNDIRFVNDGVELLQYLKHEGKFSDPESSPRPGMILLDLNMPRMDGREALALIKKDESLRQIPIVVLTTSSAEEDVFKSYDVGVNSYVTKPVTFEGLTTLMKSFKSYWFSIVEFPEDHS